MNEARYKILHNATNGWYLIKENATNLTKDQCDQMLSNLVNIEGVNPNDLRAVKLAAPTNSSTMLYDEEPKSTVENIPEPTIQPTIGELTPELDANLTSITKTLGGTITYHSCYDANNQWNKITIEYNRQSKK